MKSRNTRSPWNLSLEKTAWLVVWEDIQKCIINFGCQAFAHPSMFKEFPQLYVFRNPLIELKLLDNLLLLSSPFIRRKHSVQPTIKEKEFQKGMKNREEGAIVAVLEAAYHCDLGRLATEPDSVSPTPPRFGEGFIFLLIFLSVSKYDSLPIQMISFPSSS